MVLLASAVGQCVRYGAKDDLKSSHTSALGIFNPSSSNGCAGGCKPNKT